jgi:hypothetical protein
VIGFEPVNSPDDSEGKPPQDFGTLHYVGDALQQLEGAVESADARPTADTYAAFSVLKREADKAIREVTVLH